MSISIISKRSWFVAIAGTLLAGALLAVSVGSPSESAAPSSAELASVFLNDRHTPAGAEVRKGEWVEDFLPNMAIAADDVSSGRWFRSEPLGDGEFHRLVRATVTDVGRGVAILSGETSKIVPWESPTPDGFSRSESVEITFEVTDTLGSSVDTGVSITGHAFINVPLEEALPVFERLDDVLVVFDHNVKGDWLSTIWRLAPVLDDGTIQSDPNAVYPWRFSNVDALSEFAHGPGETIIIEDPQRTNLRWNLIDRVPNDEVEDKNAPARDPYRPESR